MDLSKALFCVFLFTLSLSSFADVVNINTADADTIANELHGIGFSKATLVIDYRNKYGPFKAVEDVALVKGIGLRTIDLNRDKIVLE